MGENRDDGPSIENSLDYRESLLKVRAILPVSLEYWQQVESHFELFLIIQDIEEALMIGGFKILPDYHKAQSHLVNQRHQPEDSRHHPGPCVQSSITGYIATKLYDDQTGEEFIWSDEPSSSALVERNVYRGNKEIGLTESLQALYFTRPLKLIENEAEPPLKTLTTSMQQEQSGLSIKRQSRLSYGVATDRQSTELLESQNNFTAITNADDLITEFSYSRTTYSDYDPPTKRSFLLRVFRNQDKPSDADLLERISLKQAPNCRDIYILDGLQRQPNGSNEISFKKTWRPGTDISENI